jgi:hypothetical protein
VNMGTAKGLMAKSDSRAHDRELTVACEPARDAHRLPRFAACDHRHVIGRRALYNAKAPRLRRGILTLLTG